MFDVRLFLMKQDSLFVQLQPGFVICLQNCNAMVYGSLPGVKVENKMLLKL
jgi:hypothetical protein